MRSHQAREINERIGAIEALLDELHRSIERIEIVTVVREPNTGMSADAYNGLRKQVIGAMSERMAHLHQLAQFDASLRAGATSEDLAALVGEWATQAALEVVEDPTREEAFELVGDETGDGRRLVRPAYLDSVTGRVVRGGIAERVELDTAAAADPRALTTEDLEYPVDAEADDEPTVTEASINTPRGVQ
jgi:hypothetical protein